MDVDYIRPCKTREVRDDFDDHVKRGSKMPGLDYATKSGDKVYATATGMVVACSNFANQVLGRHVAIRHRDGRVSWYLHLDKPMASNGQRVKMGDVIGLAGNTGTTSTGPHLHFAIKAKNGSFIDPAKLLRKELAEKKAENAARRAAAAAEVVAPVAEVVPE
jgi:murein DD-endopeptidase MepM/ murein hydrolase activator NlpD